MNYPRVTESQTHSMLGVGRDLCGSPSPTPCPSRVTQSRGHSTVPRRGWNISREGDSPAPLGSLGQGSGTLRGKFFLRFRRNAPHMAEEEEEEEADCLHLPLPYSQRQNTCPCCQDLARPRGALVGSFHPAETGAFCCLVLSPKAEAARDFSGEIPPRHPKPFPGRDSTGCSAGSAGTGRPEVKLPSLRWDLRPWPRAERKPRGQKPGTSR